MQIADGDDGMVAGSCPNRAESSAMNTKSRSLIIQNYFPTDPNTTEACVDNSASLTSMMKTCYVAAGNRWPNFIAVDFYQVWTHLHLYSLSTKSKNLDSWKIIVLLGTRTEQKVTYKTELNLTSLIHWCFDAEEWWWGCPRSCRWSKWSAYLWMCQYFLLQGLPLLLLFFPVLTIRQLTNKISLLIWLGISLIWFRLSRNTYKF